MLRCETSIDDFNKCRYFDRIEEDSVNFEGLCLPDNVVFEGKIKLYAKVLPEKSSQINKGRNVELILRKVSDPTRLTCSNRIVFKLFSLHCRRTANALSGQDSRSKTPNSTG